MIAAAVETLVMAQHQSRDRLAFPAQRRKRALAMIGMKPCRVGLARGQGSGPHPGRDRHREFADIMGVCRPADVANIGSGKAHMLARRIGKRRHCARMSEREGHSHVDHIGDRQVGFLAPFLVEHGVGKRLQRQDRLAVDRPIESFEQAFGMSEEQIGEFRFVGTAAAFCDHRRHCLHAMGLG